MLLLATSLRCELEKVDISNKIEGGEFNWMSAVELLAKASAKQVHKLNQVSEITDFWDSFLPTPDVRNLPAECQKLLKLVQKQSVKPATSTAVSVLDTANKAAHERIKALLNAKGIKQKLRASPAQVSVVYDSAGKEYCAATSGRAQSIRWAFQPQVEHCLYGPMSVQQVFAHEYFSHLGNL